MPQDRKLPNFDRQPMLWLSVSFVAGVLCSRVVDIGLVVPMAACLILAAAAFIIRYGRTATYLVLMAFIFAGLASAGVEMHSVRADRVRSIYDAGEINSGDPITAEGVLLGRPEQSVDGIFLTLKTARIIYRGREYNASGNIRLFVSGTDESSSVGLRYGSRIRVECRLTREDGFLDPGVIPKKQILDSSGIDATGSVKSPLLIEKLADESVLLPLAWVYDQRANIIDIFRANLSPRAAGVMIASLLGNKYFLDKETADLFRDGGTFHILIISGLHVTFIGGLLLLILRRLTRRRWIHAAITVSVLWAYTLAVGADVPVVRAAVMFTVVLYAYVVYRQAALVNSLGVCALVLLVWRPSDLFDPSFQLTFTSVAAIVAVVYPLVETIRNIGIWTPSAERPFPPNVPVWLKRTCEMLYWNPEAWAIESSQQIWSANIMKSPYFAGWSVGFAQRFVRFIAEGMAVSTIVQICMLPLSVVYFHRVSISSIVLNIWVGILIGVESFAAVAGAIASGAATWLGTPFFKFADLVDRLMMSLPQAFFDNGFASFRLPAYVGPARIVYFVYAVPIAMFVVSIVKWRPFDLKKLAVWVRREWLLTAAALLTVLSAIIIFHPLSKPRPDGRLHVDLLDVGQGDAALVTFPDGTTMLVDGGGRINYKAADEGTEAFVPDTRGIGEAVVSEFLWYRGLSRIDHIVATHADADHIQGLNDVAKNFSVGSAVFGRTPSDDPDFAELALTLKRRGIASESVARGHTLRFGDVTVEILYPTPTDEPDSVSDNDHSVVIRLVMGNRAFLLTGDIERAAETELVSVGGSLRADVIKVPHHGSRTSSTQQLIDAVGARYAIISVGRTSPFGHPHPDVVARWQASGAEVMTTGTSGMISFSTDGTDLKIERFAPR